MECVSEWFLATSPNLRDYHLRLEAFPECAFARLDHPPRRVHHRLDRTQQRFLSYTEISEWDSSDHLPLGRTISQMWLASVKMSMLGFFHKFRNALRREGEGGGCKKVEENHKLARYGIYERALITTEN